MTDCTLDGSPITASVVANNLLGANILIAESVAAIGTTKYLTLAEACTAAEAGQTIELLSDAPLTDTLTISKAITIDGKDHKVYPDTPSYFENAASEQSAASSAKNLITVNADGVLLKNLTIEARAHTRYCLGAENGHTVTVENVNVDVRSHSSRGCDAIQLNGGLIVKGNLTIYVGAVKRFYSDDGKTHYENGFVSQNWGGISFNNLDCSIRFEDGVTFEGENLYSEELEAYGQTQAMIHLWHTWTFTKANIDAAFAKVTGTIPENLVKVVGDSFPMTGYEVKDSQFLTDNYGIVNETSGEYFQSLGYAAYYAKKGDTVKLLADANLNAGMSAKLGAWTLDANGKTLTVKGTLTITDGVYETNCFTLDGDGKIILTGGTYSFAKPEGWTIADGYAAKDNGNDTWTVMPTELANENMTANDVTPEAIAADDALTAINNDLVTNVADETAVTAELEYKVDPVDPATTVKVEMDYDALQALTEELEAKGVDLTEIAYNDGTNTTTSKTVLRLNVDEVDKNAAQNESYGLTDEDVVAFDVSLYATTVTTVKNNSTDATTTTSTTRPVSLSTGVTKVYLPYAKATYDAEKAAGKIFAVYYVDDAGNRTNMNATYDSIAEAFVFETSHNSVYAVNAIDLATAESNATDNITVKLEQVGASRKYQVMLYAEDTKYINGFTAADMTFDLELDSAKDTLFYTVEGYSSNEYVTNVTNYGAKYMFSLDGIKASEVTGASFCIGYVTFGGYGNGYFGVDTSVKDENNDIVNTKTSDQVDVIYTVGGTKNVVFDKFTPDAGVTKTNMLRIEIEPAKSDLTVNVTFPNEVKDQAYLYQDMTVTISGGDLTAPIIFNLGSDKSSATSGSDWYENDLAGEGASAYGGKAAFEYTTTTAYSIDASKYTITLDDILSKYIRYTVTVEGAGYRTTSYTIYMNDDAETLTFWNNVMDAATVVEAAKADSTVRVNYLAGDIVQDYQINIYDLSAVVSYFGRTNATGAASDYAKYDLNRDGMIDSIDVAYVLLSWGW